MALEPQNEHIEASVEVEEKLGDKWRDRNSMSTTDEDEMQVYVPTFYN